MKRLIFIFCLICSSVSASHNRGSSLTIQHLGSGNTYVVIYTFFRDCAGVPMPTQFTINYDYNGTTHDSVIVQLAQTSVVTSTMCPMQTANCASGVGVEKYVYQNVVTLQGNGIYKFYRKVTLPSSPFPLPVSINDYVYVEALLIIGPLFQNSLPEFTSDAELNFPLSTPIIYNSFATDVDGDSIIYSIIPVLVYDSAAQGPVGYGYTPPNSPSTFGLFITPATINAWTGAISFTATQVALGAMAIRADEYRNGVWIGSVMRQTSAAGTTACVTGIEEFRETESAFYPNPATGKIKITGKIKTYSIADVSGKILQNGIPDNETIDISSLKEGIYIISLQRNSNTQSCKLIKM